MRVVGLALGLVLAAPFDRAACAAAVSHVNVNECRLSADGPTGAGHVTITFEPEGWVSQAVVDAGPFPGTASGACIAAKFRAIRIPPFEGAPVRVGKSFAVN